MRRFHQTVDRRYVFRPGVYAILPIEGKILLTHQTGLNEEYQIPGGGIDPNEMVLQALHREVLEETGWRIHNPKFLTAYRRFTYMADYDMWAEKLCKIYVAQPIRKLSPPLEEGHTAILATPSAAVEILSNDIDRDILRVVFNL